MTVIRFLKLPRKSNSKYEVICLILFLNLLVGFFCLHSWRTVSFISANTNDSRSSNERSILKLILSQRNSGESVFPHPYKYIIPNSDFCSKGSILLLIILVCTAPDNFLQRQTIRETWGSVASLSSSTGVIRVGFLLGKTSNLTVQQTIMNESATHSDIIQEDFVDSYRNLTLKSVMLLKWTTTFCPNARYVVKSDDDMYINTDNLIKTFQKLPHANNIVYGTLGRQLKPVRDVSSKWFVPETQFKEAFFPDYILGNCYVMTHDAVPKLLEASYGLPFLVVEDVFITGLCADKAGVVRVNMPGFDYRRRQPTGCSFRDTVTGTYVKPSEMRRIWIELHNKNLTCGIQKTVRTDNLINKQKF